MKKLPAAFEQSIWLRGALDKLLSRPLTDSHIDRLLIVALYQLEHTQAAPYAAYTSAACSCR